MKRIRWAMVVCVMLVAALSSTAGQRWDGQRWDGQRVRASTPYPAHNVPITVTHGSCRVTFQHGNYGGAYAQAARQTGARCLYPPFVEVTGYANGQWRTDHCDGVPSCFGNGWYQAYTPGYSIVSSALVLCFGTPTLQDCKRITYSGL